MRLTFDYPDSIIEEMDILITKGEYRNRTQVANDALHYFMENKKIHKSEMFLQYIMAPLFFLTISILMAIITYNIVFVFMAGMASLYLFLYTHFFTKKHGRLLKKQKIKKKVKFCQ